VHRRALTDVRWRACYHALRSVERIASGSSGLSPNQRDTLRALILDDVAAAPAAASPLSQGVLPMWLGAATAAVLFVVIGQPSQPPSHDWAERGDGGVVVGVRARCIDPVNHAVRSLAEGGTTTAVQGGRLACRPNDVIALDATNLGDGDRFVAVVLFGKDGAEVVDDDAGRPLFFPVPRGSVGLALPQGIELGDAGARTLFALFWSKPSEGAMRSLVDDLRRAGLEPRGLAVLPGDAEAQARIDVDVAAP
jgi:hypothetical protein